MKETSLVLMSRIKVYLLVVLMAFIMAALSSCGDDDDGASPMDPTLVDAAESAGLTTLLAAVEAADLGSTLLNAPEITVFAPTDAAFQNLLDSVGVDNLNQLVARIGGVGNLQEVLGFHVIPAIAFSGDLPEGEETFPTLTAPVQQLTVIRSGDNVSVRDAAGNTYQVTTPNVAIDNGVVHVINGVLLPNLTLPTVTAAVEADPNLSSLEAAIGAVEGLGEDLNNLPSKTIFAPNDAAFASAVQAFGVADANELIDALGANLATVLGFHVINGNTLFSDELEPTQTVTTLAGEQLTVNRSGTGVVTITDIQGNTSTVDMADIAIENGVVHVIDGVLLPTLPISFTAQINPDLSILAEALERVELFSTFNGTMNSPWTVFAPTNAAFQALLGEIGQNALEDIPNDVLERILRYHVVGDSLPASLLSSPLNTLLETAEGSSEPFESLMINTASGVVINNPDAGGATVTGANVLATNGVVHVIDAVLVPPLELTILNTVVEPAYFNADFSILVDALEAANLVETLLTGQNLTVFAPTNTAFETFIGDSDFTSAEDLLSDPMLDTILLYHVLGTEVPASALPGEGNNLGTTIYLPTLSPGPEDVAPNSTSLSLQVRNNRTLTGGVTITAVDIEADNGTVHVLSGVLVPPTVVDIAVGDGRFTSLAGALGTAGLVETLSDGGPFTVFAPTDDAFGAINVPTDVDVLRDVLLYHVTDAGNIVSGNLNQGDNTVTTLLGDGADGNEQFTVNVSSDTPPVISVAANASNGEVIITDIQGTNGVIHVVDFVLLPQ